MKMCPLYQKIPHSGISWKEGAEVCLRSNKGDDKLMIPGGVSAGGVIVWLSPWLTECGQVRGVLLMGHVNDTQTCHIATLL